MSASSEASRQHHSAHCSLLQEHKKTCCYFVLPSSLHLQHETVGCLSCSGLVSTSPQQSSSCDTTTPNSACAGACWRVGEACEQLWAHIKSLASLTRYMAKPNYLDCLDDFFGYVAATRMAEFVPFMVEQHRSNVRKLGE